jgi:agmatine deiminase
MIITFIADKMLDRFPNFASALLSISRRENAFVRIIEGTKDIWIRDYMPIILPSGKMIQFKYEPSYLTQGYDHLITETGILEKQFGFPTKKSKLNLDGGNYVRIGNTVMICDRILSENPTVSPHEVRSRLKFMLEAEKIILLPTHPCDPVGHADGIVAVSDNNKVIIEQLKQTASEVEIAFYNQLKTTLQKANLHVVECPLDLPDDGYINIWDNRGSYLNFSFIGNTILIPVYQNTDKKKFLNSLSLNFRSAKYG